MSLAPIVELYRACGRPKIEGVDFLGRLSFAAGLDIVRRVMATQQGRFLYLLIDGNEVLDGDELPDNGQGIEFKYRLPSGSSSTFHINLTTLLKREPKISRGQMPSDFYLIDKDFYSEEGSEAKEIEKLEVLCKSISYLSDLAHYHDEKPGGDCFRLVFVQPAEGDPLPPVVIETRIDESIVESAGNLDPQLLSQLCATSARSDPHYGAKVGVFGTALANFLGGAEKGREFYYLVCHWNEFVESYHRHLGTYLSGFAFHKAKREVAEAEFDVASQFAKVVSDIATKLLGIPLSLGAVIAILRAEGLVEKIVLTLGLLLAGLIMSGAVGNQQRQLKRISHAKQTLFDALEGRRETYPRDLAKAVCNMISGLNRNERRLWLTLWTFRVLCWLPVAVGLGIVLHQYA